MRKIAIPVENNRVCQHFGHCRQFAVYNVDDNKIISENFLTPPRHEPGVLPAWLAEKGVKDVIAGGMGQRAINLFLNQKINVYVGVAPKEPKELVQDLINDKLDAGKNLCDH